MAKISDASLSITQNSDGTSTPVVKCKITFTPYERTQMMTGLRFRLRCELWGDDAWLFGGDDKLYTYIPLKYFPDATPALVENVTFTATIPEGVLDEDIGRDEIYSRLTLTNLYTMVSSTTKTNTVYHSF